jgi:DNA replication and repair protein RecF
MLNNENQEIYNHINSVRVRSFRNHNDIELSPGKSSVLIVGNNGVGKTSILEALSIFSHGKGIRNAKFYDMIKNDKESFLVDISLSTSGDFSWCYRTSYSKKSRNRKILINDKEISANNARKNIPMLWIAPYTERIFLGSSSMRRNFLDRLVVIFDNEHSVRLNEYDKNLKQRTKLLKDGVNDLSWLEVLEDHLAKLSVAISSSRLETINRLTKYLNNSIKYFPRIDLSFSGSIETRLENEPALDIEETLVKDYFKSREVDAILGGSRIGCHKTDLIIKNLEKNLNAELCSSGEQKSLLISIVLATAISFKEYSRKSPIILLDEIFTHLDLSRKSNLLEKLMEIKSQIWVTATEKESFFQNKENFWYHNLEGNKIKNA